MALLFISAFYGCTPAVNSSLLTGNSTSGVTEETQAIEGQLEVAFDTGEIFASPADGDLVEVAGTCKDLSRKNNRILVQVYEGEDDSVVPVIDNSIGVMCQDNISTSSLQSVAGVGKTCLVVSQGIGIADTGLTVSQFPQCINGRFSFFIRPGRIIRRNTVLNDQSEDTNPKVKYLVKVKLRTIESLINDSNPISMVINRKIQPPVFTGFVANNTNKQCEIAFNPAKFRDIRYSLHATWTGPSAFASGTLTNIVSGAVYSDAQPTFPPKGDGTTIENFFHFGEGGPTDVSGTSTASKGLMPGVKYTYKIQAADFSYRNVATPLLTDYEVQFGGVSGTVERSDFFISTATCEMYRPQVENKTFSATQCRFTLGSTNLNLNYKLEWRVAKSSISWMETNPNEGFLISGADCRDKQVCTVGKGKTFITPSGPETFVADTSYFFAARQYFDSNKNDQLDPGIDEIIGNWSVVGGIDSDSNQAIHECVFE